MRFTSKTFRKRAKLSRKRTRKQKKQKQRGGSGGDLPKSLFFHPGAVVADPLREEKPYEDVKV